MLCVMLLALKFLNEWEELKGDPLRKWVGYLNSEGILNHSTARKGSHRLFFVVFFGGGVNIIEFEHAETP